MTTKDRIGSKYIRYGILSFLIFSLLISVTITVGAEQTIDHNNTGNKSCGDCHSGVHQDKGVKQGTASKQTITKKQPNNILPKTTSSANSANAVRQSGATNTVIGNINIIGSLGQDWYQQGIFGPSAYGGLSDQSWGWTFYEDTPPNEFLVIPAEKVNQKNNIYALLLDDGNNSQLITGAQVTANVKYWKYNGISYMSDIDTVQLVEDVNRPGFYNGTFYFYGGTQGDAEDCTFCHLWSGGDIKTGYFPGDYEVDITANADSKVANSKLNFNVTAWGCEDCHGSGNRHLMGWFDADSSCYICHGINQISHDGTDAGNPHQNTPHRNLPCTDCHTNKVIDEGTFTGVTFDENGKPQYVSNIIGMNGGKHSTVTCVECHGNLVLPDVPGGYNSNGYKIYEVINNYTGAFANIKQFQDYYVIDVTGGGPLTINFDWTGPNLGFYVYPPNFNPRNNIDAIYDGATFTNKPEIYTNNAPMTGKWIVAVYGYDLIDEGWWWKGYMQPPIGYNITSTYPLVMKDMPKSPECNTCHNSGGQGNASTKYDIPSWNPGYAHADTNGDGNLDVQCRMCHDSMHNIDIKNCRDCHNNVPTGHIIVEPQYSQYTTSQCLLCHGDPHKVSAQAEACIECHGIGYEGANPVATITLVNISVFNTSIHQNINDIVNKDYNVTNEDCWQCHYNKDMNRQNVRKCGYCHNKASQWHGDANVTTNLTELAIR